MNANQSDCESIQRAYERFYQLAHPTWSQRVAAVDAALEQSQNRRADGRHRQFSVGIVDRPQLDALSKVLGLPRSKIINLALGELAEMVEGFDDFYAELFAESCQGAAHYLFDEYNLAGDEAVVVAERFGRKYLPKRGRWLKILHGKGDPQRITPRLFASTRKMDQTPTWLQRKNCCGSASKKSLPRSSTGAGVARSGDGSIPEPSRSPCNLSEREAAVYSATCDSSPSLISKGYIGLVHSENLDLIHDARAFRAPGRLPTHVA